MKSKPYHMNFHNFKFGRVWLDSNRASNHTMQQTSLIIMSVAEMHTNSFFSYCCNFFNLINMTVLTKLKI